MVHEPYKILGVSEKATADEIKNAYRALAKKFHPDLNPGDKTAEHKFKEVNAAYEILGDAEKRAQFDRGEWGDDHSAHRRHGGPFYRDTQGGAQYARGTSPGFDESIFENLFRGGARQRSAGGFSMPGEDEQYRLDLSLREAIEGGLRELQLPSGKRLSVKIPSGVFAGQRLRFAGQGGPGFGGGPAGDVYVELRLAPDERFVLEGASLRHDLSVPFDVALLGGEMNVPTPEGQVRLTVPPRTSSGRRLRVPGKGVFARGGKRGDLLVQVMVSVPAQPDENLEAAVRAWRERMGRNAL